MSGFLQADIIGTILIVLLLILRIPLRAVVPARAFAVLWDAAALRLIIPSSVSGVVGLGSAAALLFPEAAGGAEVHGAGFSTVDGIWLTGTAAAAAIMIACCVRETRLLRMALPLMEEDTARCRALLPEGSRQIRILASDRITTAVACGVFRKRIILPKHFAHWSDRTLQCVLVHEYMHLRRADNLRRLVMLGAAGLHWFNPFVWAAVIFSQRTVEEACDEYSIEQLGAGSRTEYADALLCLAEEQANLRIAGSAFSRRTRAGERIAAALHTTRWSAVSIGIFLMLSAVVLSSFASGTAAERISSKTADTEAAPFAAVNKEVFILDESSGALRDLEGHLVGYVRSDGVSVFEITSSDEADFRTAIARTDTDGGAVQYTITAGSDPS